MKDSPTDTILNKKPYLTKLELSLLWEKKGKNLDNKIQTLLHNNQLISLKNGLYVSQTYLSQWANKTSYLEFVANILYYPSYLSLEYVLQKENVIPEAVYVYTSITNKLTRHYQNDLGSFSYRSLKPELFTGFEEVNFNGIHQVKIATKVKALFDWLYLKTFANPLAQEIKYDLRINWQLFNLDDLAEFAQYAQLSKVKKMTRIYELFHQKLS
ncbi:MAG: hypothetical protein ABIJ03_01855 [Patescibacteria group bacterium]|nr:hypothetical protein [Patescibacteria group bacterium]